jgi:Acyl-CoA thioesterase C-terminal domain/Acyl-CoA thioesterase N-terminal domain
VIGSRDPAFFRIEGDLVVGYEPARGPWDAEACHGGPVTGVLVRALERLDTGKQLVRVTVAFTRPVPIAGFRIAAAIDRKGRTATTVNATLTDVKGRVSALASGVLLDHGDFGPFPTASLPHPDFDDAAAGDFPVDRGLHGLPFFNTGVEVRTPRGESTDPGPKTMWMRTLPIVDGEKPSPVQSLCPIADCGNGISRNGRFGDTSCVNPDLTVVVFRLPVSEWLASRATSYWEPSGIGASHAELFDTRGLVGFALQSLVLRPLK